MPVGAFTAKKRCAENCGNDPRRQFKRCNNTTTDEVRHGHEDGTCRHGNRSRISSKPLHEESTTS